VVIMRDIFRDVSKEVAVTIPVFMLASRSTRGVLFNIAAVNTILAVAPPVILSLL
jgi:hypothetical protein